VTTGSRFGVTLYGSRGVIYAPLTQVPQAPAMILRSASWADGNWETLQPPPDGVLETRHGANALMVRDLLEAIEGNRQPVCGARDGRWTIEMVTGIYQSQAAGAAVHFPLRDRRNPLRVP
jgi:hypothetical protein